MFLGLKAYSKCAGDDLNNWVKRNLERYQSYEWHMDCHWLPQYKYVYDDSGNQVCDFVVKLERYGRFYVEQLRFLEDIFHFTGLTAFASERRNAANRHCGHVEQLSTEVRKMVHDAYSQDYHMWTKADIFIKGLYLDDSTFR